MVRLRQSLPERLPKRMQRWANFFFFRISTGFSAALTSLEGNPPPKVLIASTIVSIFFFEERNFVHFGWLLCNYSLLSYRYSRELFVPRQIISAGRDPRVRDYEEKSETFVLLWTCGCSLCTFKAISSFSSEVQSERFQQNQSHPISFQNGDRSKAQRKCWRLFITLKMRSIACHFMSFRRLLGCLGIQNFNSDGWRPLHSEGWNTSICISWKNVQKKVAVYFPWHHEIIERMWKRAGNLAWRIIFLFSFLENRRKLGIQVEFKLNKTV